MRKRIFPFFVVLLSVIFCAMVSAQDEKGQNAQSPPPRLATKLITLKYVDSQDVLEPLEKVVSSSGSLEVFDIPGRAPNTILVQDLPERMPEIERLIASLDTPVPSATKISVNYSDASLLDVLRSISEDTHINIIAGKNVTGNVTVHLVDVSLEKALDAILLSNGYTYIKEDNILRVLPVSELKKKDETLGMETKVFVLRYASAEDLKPTLEKLISKDGLIQVPARTNADSSKARSKTILVKDRPQVVWDIAKVIEDLDKELSQVLIEAKFMNVQLDNTDKMGIDWVIKATLSGAAAPTTFPFPNKRQVVDKHGRLIPQPSPSSSDFGLSDLFPYATKGDFTFGTLSFNQTQAVLEMLEQKQKVKLVSAPRVVVLDGEEALINIGENYPIPLYEHSKDTGLLYISGYQETKIGIILRVTPHIIGDNKVMLNLHPEVSEISGYIGPNDERPVTSTKEVNTSVSVTNGDTILMGGMIKEQVTTNDNRVPLLGNVPLLGRLFSYKSKVFSRTELLIFLTPHIINKENKVIVSASAQAEGEGGRD